MGRSTGPCWTDLDPQSRLKSGSPQSGRVQQRVQQPRRLSLARRDQLRPRTSGNDRHRPWWLEFASRGSGFKSLSSPAQLQPEPAIAKIARQSLLCATTSEDTHGVTIIAEPFARQHALMFFSSAGFPAPSSWWCWWQPMPGERMCGSRPVSSSSPR